MGKTDACEEIVRTKEENEENKILALTATRINGRYYLFMCYALC